MANPEHERVLREAIRSRAQFALAGCDLRKILFPSIRLEGADLSGADLRGAELSGGYFRGANLRQARLAKARITLGDFRDADLSGADLTGCDLLGSVLNGADLNGADLTRASLVKARLEGTDLTDALLDRTDLRGSLGLTPRQLASALKTEAAILDERLLALLDRKGDPVTARHGHRRPARRSENLFEVRFLSARPMFGDLFLISGRQHPEFPPSGRFGFEDLADLGFEQVDDAFAICDHGDPVLWILPLVRGRVVAHHPGPFAGLRFELAEASATPLLLSCVARFQSAVRVPIAIIENRAP